MTKRELIDLCLTLPASVETYPFDETTAVIKHRGNGKMFALVSERDGTASINLKCEPMRADFLRSVYSSVTTGYHMNKTHWNTVTTGGDVPEDELMDMIWHSNDLVKPKRKGGSTNDRTKRNPYPLRMGTNRTQPHLSRHRMGCATA